MGVKLEGCAIERVLVDLGERRRPEMLDDRRQEALSPPCFR
jgi:hypothetical protein